ncbi:MAG: hypothetical protein SGARI_006614, partial [Bacillariaceae sp.]
SDDDKEVSLESLADKLANNKVKNVVVLIGAGASVSAGIPDFRSPGTGLYDRLQRPTLAHAFCKVLEEKGILRRIYTQNIDGLEAIAGVSTGKLVECHGHFRSSSCIKCRSPMEINACRDVMVENTKVPICTKCGSFVKPDIVFFGEELPSRFQELLSDDTDAADLLVVMGTSLMVMPVAGIPNWVAKDCPRLLVNRERVGNFLRIQSRDVFLEGECDDGVRDLSRLVGWEDLLDQRFQECR